MEENWFDKGLKYWEKKDYEHAVECYREGVKAGDIDCMDNLAVCYFWGYGVETDLQKSSYYHEKAAKAGSVRAMYNTGLNYEHGYGVSQNMNKALFWLEKAAENNYQMAYAELGNIYSHGAYVNKDLEKAFNYYRKGADMGGIESKLNIATFYEKGIATEEDIEKAKALYQEAFDYYYDKAVSEDDREAQFKLGFFYFMGLNSIDLEQNYIQAAEWYERAAKNGHDNAQNSLGNMYYLGLGVEQNYDKAFYWYSQAVKRMSLAAMNNVATCYYLGLGVQKDYSKAAEYYSKAANLGHPNSQEVLGEMYMSGEGVEQNYTKAVYWLRESCNNGERSAFGPLGDCYRKGLGVDKDEKSAFELYKEGAKKKDIQSMVSMSECLIEGWGTKCDDKLAYQILSMVCNVEKKYREDLVSFTSHEDEGGRLLLEDPLNEENLPHYAKAYYLLGLLTYTGKGSDEGGNAIKTLALLRMAERLGYQEQENSKLNLENLINKIENDSKRNEGVANSYIEIRDLGNRIKDGRYDVVIHHVDGTESTVRFGTDRRKFCYLLLLLLVSNKNSIQGLMARYFCYARERLASLAEITKLYDEEGPGKWIEAFTYDLKATGKDSWSYEHANWMYSNEMRKSSEFFDEVCDEEELELYRVRSTGGRNSITTISVKAESIVIPDSLLKYTRELPSRQFMISYEALKRRPENFEVAKQKYSSYFEDWDESDSGQMLPME